MSKIEIESTFIFKYLLNELLFNTESALTGDLKISRMSTVVGSAAGNEDLFIFVGKVGKSKLFMLAIEFEIA